MLNKKNHISLIKFDDLKLGLYDTTTEEESYISEEDFNNTYQNHNIKRALKENH
jgi:hypothetical protein